MPSHRMFLVFATIAVAGPFTSFACAIQQPSDAANTAYAQVDEATARSIVKGCSLPQEVSGPGTPGSQIILQFTVSEKGKLLGVHRVEGAFTHELGARFASCHFTPYKVNGKAVAFQAPITINVK